MAVSRCRSFNAAVLLRAKTIDTVILASRWPAPGERDFAADLTATIDQLSPHVRRILIIGATPDLPASVPDCIRRHSPSSCEIARQQFIAQSTAIRTLLSSLQSRHPNITYVEPLDFFCNQTTCPGVRNGIALYFTGTAITSPLPPLPSSDASSSQGKR